MIRRSVPLVLLTLLGGVLAALPGTARAATPAPGTILLAQRVIRNGTLHDQRAYQAHFQVQGFPGDTQPGLVQMLSSTRVIRASATIDNPCPDADGSCSDVWDVWVPLAGSPGTFDVRLIVHDADLSDGTAGQPRWLTLGPVVVQEQVAVHAVATSHAARVRVWSGRQVGSCSRMRSPGRRLGAGSVGLYSQARCRRHRRHAGRVQQVFAVTPPLLAATERVRSPSALVRLAGARSRGRVRVWVRAPGAGGRWLPCTVSWPRRSTLNRCVFPWSPALLDRPLGPVQVQVRAQGGARVDVGRVGVDVEYLVWQNPS